MQYCMFISLSSEPYVHSTKLHKDTSAAVLVYTFILPVCDTTTLAL